MKLSNFRVLSERQLGYGADIFAQVDVTTGSLWWKKTETRTINKPPAGVFWFFVDSGVFTPGYQAEMLFNAWEAQKRLRATA